MAMESVIITGASGFIGSRLVQYYLERGVKVTAVVRKEGSLSVQKSENLKLVCADFSEYDTLAQRIGDGKYDIFYHLAWGGYGAATNDYTAQVLNIRPVCDAVMQASALGCRRFVFSTSFSEFMISENDGKSHADGAYCNVYGSAKAAARLMAQAVAAQRGMDFISVAFANTFGPGDASKRSTNLFIHQLLNATPLNLTKGEHLYDWNYIDDALEGLRLAGELGKSDAVYYIGSNERRPLKEIVSEVRDILAPNVPIHLGVYRESFYVDYPCVDVHRLYRDTGYRAKADFRSSILQTAQWVKALPWE